MRWVMVVAFVLSLGSYSRWAAAQSAPDAGKIQSSALINEAMDKQVALELNGTLPQVMDKIGQETGVRLEADPAVWDLLPWGQNTTITATIKNQTLREALSAMTRKLGLQFVLKDEAVELEPMPALRRLGKRATVQELGALDVLASSPANLGAGELTVKTLIDGVNKRLLELKSSFAVENRIGNSVRQDQKIAVPRNATLMEALEELPKQTRATWYPWGKTIVILPKEDQVREQVEKKITVRYDGVDVQQVLTELSQRAGVEFSMEPGAIQRIAPEFRKIRLILGDGTIKQALEAISAVTGLGYVVSDSGVYLWNQHAGAGAGGRIVGFLQVTELGVMVPLRENEIPADMREYIQAKAQKQLDELAAKMKEENFKPATQPVPAPATQPGNQDL